MTTQICCCDSEWTLRPLYIRRVQSHRRSVSTSSSIIGRFLRSSIVMVGPVHRRSNRKPKRSHLLPPAGCCRRYSFFLALVTSSICVMHQSAMCGVKHFLVHRIINHRPAWVARDARTAREFQSLIMLLPLVYYWSLLVGPHSSFEALWPPSPGQSNMTGQCKGYVRLPSRNYANNAWLGPDRQLVQDLAAKVLVSPFNPPKHRKQQEVR